MPPQGQDNTDLKKETNINPEQTASNPPLNKDNASETLVNKVASESPVQNTENFNNNDTSEEKFIDFVAKKSSEIPTDEQTKRTEKPKKEKRKWGDVIRTYYTDVEETVRDQKISMAKMVAAEENARDKKPISQSDDSKEKVKLNWKRIFITFFSIVLIVAGIVLLYFLYLNYREKTVAPPLPAGSLLLANQRITIDTTDFSRDELILTLEDASLLLDADVNDVINVELIAGPNIKEINAQKFLDVLETSIDAALFRSVEDAFMLGIHILEKPYFFLVLKTTFFENAFSGMLRWEEQITEELPFLVRDVQKFSNDEIDIIGSSTNTVLLTTPNNFSFEDIVVANRDARAHKGSDGKVDIIYSFADPDTLIITSNETTLRMVFDRLIISRFKQ